MKRERDSDADADAAAADDDDDADNDSKDDVSLYSPWYVVEIDEERADTE